MLTTLRWISLRTAQSGYRLIVTKGKLASVILRGQTSPREKQDGQSVSMRKPGKSPGIDEGCARH